MKPSLLALVALSVFVTPAFAQEPPEGGAGGGQEKEGEEKKGNIRIRTPMERLFVAYGLCQGGRDRLNSLKTLSFRWLPHEISENGPRELSPLNVTVQLQGPERMVRLEEDVEGKHRTKLVNDLQNVARVWIDDEERRIPELLAGAQTESRVLFLLMDLLYRPESPELRSEFDQRGELERDGRKCLVATYEFHPSRALNDTYRAFYDSETGLVGRIDVHDQSTTTNKRTSSFLLTEYIPVGDPNPRAAIKFPGRIEWQDREGRTLALWRFADVEVDADLPPGHFQGP